MIVGFGDSKQTSSRQSISAKHSSCENQLSHMQWVFLVAAGGYTKFLVISWFMQILKYLTYVRRLAK